MPGAKTLSLFLTAMLLSGCAGIAKGVTQALLERSEEEDTRACRVEGPSSEGLDALSGTALLPRHDLRIV